MNVTFGWRNIYKFKALKFVNGMFIWLIIVPVLAKATQSAGSVATLIFLGHPFLVHLELPFSWVAFYFCALSFAAGNGICKLWCPRIISDHENYSGRHDYYSGLAEIERYAIEIGMNLEGVRRSAEAREAHFEKVLDVSLRREEFSLENDLFFEVQERADTVRASARRAATSCYALGLILLVVVLCQNMLYVLRFILI